MVKVSRPWREITFGAGAIHHVEYKFIYTKRSTPLKNVTALGFA